MQLSDSDFHRMVRFMQDNYGINLKQKRLLINSRLSASLQAQGYTSFKEFVDDLLNKKDKEQIEFVLNKLTTNYTYFMREKDHYDFFMKVILPDSQFGTNQFCKFLQDRQKSRIKPRPEIPYRVICPFPPNAFDGLHGSSGFIL